MNRKTTRKKKPRYSLFFLIVLFETLWGLTAFCLKAMSVLYISWWVILAPFWVPMLGIIVFVIISVFLRELLVFLARVMGDIHKSE